MIKALYPGSFDPITYGHIDIIEQACDLFDKVIIGIADNPRKSYSFSPNDRMEMVEESVRLISRDIIQTDIYGGMTVDYANAIGANVLIRGLRAVSDFEAEFQMTLFNRKNIGKQGIGKNTIFFIPQEDRVYLSSSAIKDIVRSGGNVESFVPPVVIKHLHKVI